jgi:hypothetical protein
MKRSRVWLAATGLAFAAWIGYLVYLTCQVERPSIVLSRPQFLISRDVVIAQVKKDGSVKVEDVFVSKSGIPPNAEVEVRNLRDSLHKWFKDGGDPDWELPGEFIIPLRDVNQDKAGKWSAEVVPLPPLDPRVYPVTPGTMEQLKAIPIGEG